MNAHRHLPWALLAAALALSGCTVRSGGHVRYGASATISVSAQAPQHVIVARPPPPLRAEAVIGAQPAPDAVWRPGHYEWNGTWVWIPGRWERNRTGYVWVAPVAHRRDGRIVYHPGYWAPAGTPPPPVYAQPGIAVSVVGVAPRPAPPPVVRPAPAPAPPPAVRPAPAPAPPPVVRPAPAPAPAPPPVVRPAPPPRNPPPAARPAPAPNPPTVVVRPAPAPAPNPPTVVVRPGARPTTPAPAPTPPTTRVDVRPAPPGTVTVTPTPATPPRPPATVNPGVTVRPGQGTVTPTPAQRPGLPTTTATLPGNQPPQVQPAPLTCRLDAPRAPMGGVITLNGSGFLPSARVIIGGTGAQIVSNRPTRIQVRVPGSSGGGQVRVVQGQASASCGSLSISSR